MPSVAEVLLAVVALYPVCTAALWMAGGLLFRLLDETGSAQEPEGGWPGVSVLIPAYNEEAVVATSVNAALAADYPVLEVLVLDDGSTDRTEAAALEAAGADERCRVIRDPVNRGKADRLNAGLLEARHELVAVVDADTHVHPEALKLLVARMYRSPMVAAVAGAPHVTNRGRLLLAMQMLEAASIIGLIRRTQSLTGRVGVVAGVLGLFRRDRVLAVGGYDPRMATEDIDLTWKLLLAGLGDRLRAAGARRHAGSHDAARPLGAAQALGAGPGRGHARTSRRGVPLAQPSHVAARLRVAGVAAVGPRPRGFADHRRVRRRDRRRRAVRVRVRLGRSRSRSSRRSSCSWRSGSSTATTRRSCGRSSSRRCIRLAYWLIAALAAIRSQIVALVRGPRGRARRVGHPARADRRRLGSRRLCGATDRGG